MKILKRILWILGVLFILLNLIIAAQAYHLTRFYNEKDVDPESLNHPGTLDKVEAVLLGVRIPKSKNLEQPDSAFQELYIHTSDNLKLSCWYFKASPSRGTVILFHGHGSSKSKLLHESDYIHSLGFNTLLVDFRAHGGSEGNICTIGYRESADVKAAYDYIHGLGERNIFLWGISLGAATITKAMHDYDTTLFRPSGLILEMPFGSLEQAVEGRMRIMHLPEQPFSALLTFWGGTEQGFWAFSNKPCNYARDIRCPVLLQWGARDRRVTRAEIDCIYNNLSSAQKKLVVYQSAAHESLYSREHEKWRSSISSFLLDAK